jgi:transposase-like protein
VSFPLLTDIYLEGCRGWIGVFMSTSKGSGRSRRKFTPEFKAEVVAMVDASGGKIAQVAREMRLHDSSVGNWVREAAKPRPVTVRLRPSGLRSAS